MEVTVNIKLRIGDKVILTDKAKEGFSNVDGQYVIVNRDLAIDVVPKSQLHLYKGEYCYCGGHCDCFDLKSLKTYEEMSRVPECGLIKVN